MATSSHPLLRRAPLFSPHPRPFLHFTSFSTSINQHKCKPSFIRCISSMEATAPSSLAQSEIPSTTARNSNWKPMCLYCTQDKCTLMDDPLHLSKFCHSCSIELGGRIREVKNLLGQKFDYFLVLDLGEKLRFWSFLFCCLMRKLWM